MKRMNLSSAGVNLSLGIPLDILNIGVFSRKLESFTSNKLLLI